MPKKDVMQWIVKTAGILIVMSGISAAILAGQPGQLPAVAVNDKNAILAAAAAMVVCIAVFLYGRRRQKM